MMKEKQLVEVNYTPQKQLESIKEVDCVMNKYKLNLNNIHFSAYTCTTCFGHPKNICSFCFLNCHDHDGDKSIKNIEEEVVFIKTTPCSCAMNNHNIQLNLSRPSISISQDKRNAKDPVSTC